MTGKKERSSGGGPALGRALVRHHNQMTREAKDKDAALRRQQRRTGALESVTELTDIELVLENAEEAGRIYSVANPAPALRIDLDGASGVGTAISGERRKQQMKEEALHASSLRVPRRPPWDANMSVDKLDANEREAFLAWRRSLARLEENEKLVLTPFEKNLDVWRQLWRVLERSDLLVMVVDARDPLFYRCPDLETYAQEIDEHKKTMLLVNKADLLPSHIRRKWANYFQQHGILYVFWSAKVASAALEGKKLNNILIEHNCAQESLLAEDTKICSRDELLARLQREAEVIVQKRTSNKKPMSEGGHSSNNGEGVSAFNKQVVVGFVGYPNVGKSSTINAIVGEKRTGVTSTPGKTKHFQTIIISNELMLCDCPGLVFPSFSSSRYDMVASGVLPIDRMTEHRGAVQVVANRVPRSTLESIYNIVLPKPKPYESQNRPPLALELLRAYCSSRGYVGASGLPDETRAARQILKDYIDGKLPHFAVPPGDVEDGDADLQDGLLGSNSTADSDSEEDEDVASSKEDGDVSEKPDISDLLDDLTAFDKASDMRSATASEKKKKPIASHKHHRKPQRKKDRSWRVGNDGEDGMPIVRVFQKPAVNFATIKTV